MIEIRTGGHREILKPGRKTDRRIDPQTEPKLAGQLPKYPLCASLGAGKRRGHVP